MSRNRKQASVQGNECHVTKLSKITLRGTAFYLAGKLWQ